MHLVHNIVQYPASTALCMLLLNVIFTGTLAKRVTQIDHLRLSSLQDDRFFRKGSGHETSLATTLETALTSTLILLPAAAASSNCASLPMAQSCLDGTLCNTLRINLHFATFARSYSANTTI